MTCPKQSKWWALLWGFAVPWNDWRQTPKWEPCWGLYTDLPMPRDTQHPCKSSDQKWAKHVDWTFFSRSPFPGLFDHSIIAWGIRTTNLICRIIDFQGTCDPCRYSVLLLKPQTIWMEVPSLARSWKLQEHIWDWGGALVSGTSLKLEAILLAACLRAQGPKSKSLSLLCLWSMWVAALLVTMRFLKTQIGNCRIWSDWK